MGTASYACPTCKHATHGASCLTQTCMRCPVLCSCGKALHYTNPTNHAFINTMIQKHGPTVPVQPLGSPVAYAVPRHYIALHGLQEQQVSRLASRYGWSKLGVATV